LRQIRLPPPAPLMELLRQPVPGTAKQASRQLRRVASAWLQTQGARMIHGERGITNWHSAANAGVVVAVSRCPYRIPVRDAVIFVPKLYLVQAPETLVAGFMARADVDYMHDEIAHISELWFAGYMPVAAIRRTRAYHRTPGVIALPPTFFEEPTDVRV